jgi:hypothetical protein
MGFIAATPWGGFPPCVMRGAPLSLDALHRPAGIRNARSWSDHPFGLTAIARHSGSRAAAAPAGAMIPQFVHTIRSPNVGTGTLSGHGSALRIVLWWHTPQQTSSERTPLARMLPSVIGSIGSLKRVAATVWLYDLQPVVPRQLHQVGRHPVIDPQRAAAFPLPRLGRQFLGCLLPRRRCLHREPDCGAFVVQSASATNVRPPRASQEAVWRLH